MAPRRRRAPDVIADPAYPPVRIVSGPAFELVAQLAAFTSGPARPALESGKPWIREVRALGGPSLIDRVERWAFPLYSELTSLAWESGPPYTPAGLIRQLRSMPADALYRRLLGADSPHNQAMVSDGAFDRAIAGDSAARAELRAALALNPPARQGLDRLLATPPADVQRDVAEIVEAWSTSVAPAFLEDALRLVERDIEPKEGLLRVTAPKDALRVFTKGVDIDPRAWATEIVVIPAVALRPFMAPVECGSTLLILCSIADETLDADPAAPPRRLVQVVAALGDELRLRILHELAAGDATASQLAERLGVDRTSLHHHLGILRSAGLLSVNAEGVQSWRYALRREGIAAATSALAGYLGPNGTR